MRSIARSIEYHSRKQARFSFDPLLLTVTDHRHEADELRFFSLGETRAKRLLAVAHTEQDEFIRIITARDATPTERRNYEEGE